MTALTPQQRIYQAAVEVGAFDGGPGDLEARVDHDAVDAEMKRREHAGLRADQAVRTQLEFLHRTSPVLVLDFERREYNPATGEFVTRTDANRLADFTARLQAQQTAESIPHAAFYDGGRGWEPQNDLAVQIMEAERARFEAAQLRRQAANMRLPRGVEAL